MALISIKMRRTPDNSGRLMIWVVVPDTPAYRRRNAHDRDDDGWRAMSILRHDLLREGIIQDVRPIPAEADLLTADQLRQVIDIDDDMPDSPF